MKRILILSNTFYPDPTVAAIRVTEWAKYFRNQGDRVTVVCRQYLTRRQMESGADLEGVNLIRLGMPRTEDGGDRNTEKSSGDSVSRKARHAARKLATSLVSGISVPDVAIWRQRRLLEKTLCVAESVAPEIMIVSSPPHSIHWLGGRIAAAIKVPWIADFRDPFTIDRRFMASKTNFAKRYFTNRFEESVYAQASLVTHAIPIHYRWMRRQRPQWADKMRLLTNGVPDEIAGLLGKSAPIPLIDKPQIQVFSSSTIEPATLVNLSQAFTELYPEKCLSVRFCGNAPSAIPGDTDQASFRFLGRISHQQAVSETIAADVLFSHLPDQHAAGMGLSSKLFEYLASARPVIHVNPTRSDRLFLKQWPHASVLDDPSVRELKRTLLVAISAPPSLLLNQSSRFISAYQRKTQCQQLHAWIAGVIGRSDAVLEGNGQA
ncbi:glycosyltransferase [Rhodopirellula sp. JC639]|uniref:glycosyltransferase n=1 Tax=Stieleria mannarensis TaxID=2755585 RepID=UPI001604255D|nr:glycosyltransferase [Rhodopirellula sp. JC639]